MEIEFPKELNETLNHLAERVHKKKSDLVLAAVQEYLEDLEDYLDAEQAYKEWVDGGKKTYTLEEVKAKCGLD